MGFAPVIEKTLPQTGQTVQIISKDLAAILDEVTNVEAIGQLQGLAGADKAKVLGPIVANIILGSAPLTGKKVANPTLFATACQEIGAGAADLLNSLHEDSVALVTAKVTK